MGGSSLGSVQGLDALCDLSKVLDVHRTSQCVSPIEEVKV